MWDSCNNSIRVRNNSGVYTCDLRAKQEADIKSHAYGAIIVKKIFLHISLLLPLLALNACSDTGTPAEEHNEQVFDNTDLEGDVDFATHVVSAGMAEIEMGNLAIANGSSPEVKQFGQVMITDHTSTNEELRNTVQAKKMALPMAPTDRQLKKIESLRKVTGAAFDEDYIQAVIGEHKDVISLFEKEAEKGNDPDLKTWAGAKLPILRHHLQMAEEIQQRVNKK